jgi:hypothetical protein
MIAQRITDWRLWNSVACARLPLRLLLEPQRIADRPQMKEVSASAYVFRMFELFFFQLRDPALVERFSEKERQALHEFLVTFDSLPWRPLSSHPHISELTDDNFSSLVQPAKKLDRQFRLRTGHEIIPVFYRLLRGWPILESSLLRKEGAKNGQQRF